jgi:cytochrome c peroxidase
MTGPSLPDGRFTGLDQTVSFMGRYQLGKKLSAAEVTSIVTFLKALTGEVDAAFVAKPTLPPSGPTTPKPQ